MILVVSFDAAIDRVSVVRGFSAGSRLHALRTETAPGGAGLRVALAIRAFGGSTLVCGFAAGHVGSELRRGLDAHSVRHDLVEIRGETPYRIVVLDESRGDVLDVAERGPAATPHDADLLLARVEGSLAQADLVVIAGDLPHGAPEDLPRKAAAVARAAGKRVLLDARSEPLRLAIEERPTVAAVERSDLELLLGVPVDDADALAEAISKLALARGVAALHLAAPNDALLAAEGRSTRFEAPVPRAWSSVGAREACLGALAWHLRERGDLREAVRFGCAAAACAFAAPMPARVDAREVEDLLASVRSRDVGPGGPRSPVA